MTVALHQPISKAVTPTVVATAAVIGCCNAIRDIKNINTNINMILYTIMQQVHDYCSIWHNGCSEHCTMYSLCNNWSHSSNTHCTRLEPVPLAGLTAERYHL